jgi:diguanylate cyclase (GGDEF)-like protein
VAVAAGSIGYLRAAVEAGTVDGEAGEEEVVPASLDEGLREPPPIVVPPVDRSSAAAAADDAGRLARELRGTIEELLHARRTIELQRDEIAQAATVDPLTGVASRRAILDRLRIEASEARRYQHPVAVMLLDLDDFGRLNHEWGMSIGDEVLREVALRLRLRVRSADALGRVGGDSFLALLPHTDETGAATFADALRRRLLSRPIETSAGEVAVGVSIGVAFMRAGAGLTDEELLAATDEALASARFAGGNRIAFDRAHGLIRLEGRRADGQGGA